MNKSPLRLAFIGGGHNSAVGNCHRIALAMDQKFKLVAGCFSRNKKENAKSGVIYGVDASRVYNEIHDLIKNEKNGIDCIAVLTPQPNHYKHILECLLARIPTICEKSLVASTSEAKKVIKLLKRKKGFLTVINNYTGYPMIREARSIIERESIGKVQKIQFEMPQEGFSRTNLKGKPYLPQKWRLKDNKVPTISLDLGIHLIMISSYIIHNSPQKVVAFLNSNGNFKEIIDNVSCIIKFNNGVCGNFWFSKSAVGYRNGLKLRIFCRKGSLEWLQEDPEHLKLSDAFGNIKILDRGYPDLNIAKMERYNRFKAGHPAGFIEAFANNYSDIASDLRIYIEKHKKKVPYIKSAISALDGLKFLEAVSRSSKTNKWVSVK